MQTIRAMPKNNEKLERSQINASIRSIEGEGNERKFILSFSSEEPYTRYFGSEILDHSEGALDLARLNEIGVVLYNHKRDVVIGKITKAWVEDSRGMAEIEFDDDDESEKIRKKVASGTLKGVSVGYGVDSWEEVAANKKSADGKYTGPAYIARKWQPYEISIATVPADTTVGVGREMEAVRDSASVDLYERQLRINKNLGGI